MRNLLKKLLPSVVVTLTVTGLSLPMSARAQTYPIDCAILLCLSGGWPASVPCNLARAQFIRRITPWPVEPPLQIWRCPMSTSYKTERQQKNADRILEAFLRNQNDLYPQSFPSEDVALGTKAANSTWRAPYTGTKSLIPASVPLRLTKDRADIDISSPEFSFVRSIRVIDVRYARQYEAGSEGECERSAKVYIGAYDIQGHFYWQKSSTAALPLAHDGLELWGRRCPTIYHRSVFVDWHDSQGNYGFEQVNY